MAGAPLTGRDSNYYRLTLGQQPAVIHANLENLSEYRTPAIIGGYNATILQFVKRSIVKTSFV